MYTNDFKDLLTISRKQLLDIEYLLYQHTTLKHVELVRAEQVYMIKHNFENKIEPTIFYIKTQKETRKQLRQIKKQYNIK